MFRASQADVRVNLAVVAYGVTDRLIACLDSLEHHASRTDFTITCVVNPSGVAPEPIEQIPSGVKIVTPPTNLGWPGGLHAARVEAGPTVEYFVWVQDDMVVHAGWLDALVAAADAHPAAAAFGSVGVDADGRPDAYSAGAALPYDDMDRWNDADTTREALPDEPATYDWVTSKGLLARLDAWDEIGGTDPSLFPLNHVDKDYCAHLRCHGWQVMLVPGARLNHAGDSSAPGALRAFLPGWRTPRLNARWGGPLTALGSGRAARVDHECSHWSSTDPEAIERHIGREAALMLVPFNRAIRGAAAASAIRVAELEVRTGQAERVAADLVDRTARAEEAAAAHEARAARAEASAAELEDRAARAEAGVDVIRATLSWRVTRPLRAIRARFPGR